jgi:hypothetical protein
MADMITAPPKRPSLSLLLLALLVGLLAGVTLTYISLVLWDGRTATGEQQQDPGTHAPYVHARSLAALFLRSIVEDDFQAIRPLLQEVAATEPRAAAAYGPEMKLRGEIRQWFQQRKLDGKRLKGYGLGGTLPDGWFKYAVIGALHFDDGSFVSFRVNLVQMTERNGTDSPESVWRVEKFILWAGEQDGPRPW